MTPMRSKPMAAFLTLMAVSAAAFAAHAAPTYQPPTLAADDRQHLLGDTFKTYYKSAAIPASVKATYLSPDTPGGKTKFPMAEPGKPWNDSDDVRDASLPFRRLLFVSTSKDYCVVAYEHGGIMYNRTVSLFALHGKKADLRWSGTVFGNFATLADVRTAIQAKNYRDGGRL